MPKKNIRGLCGKPLIAYTISEALKSNLLTRYIVSTDDSEIKDVAEKNGAEVPFLRPADLATDKASSMVALNHAIDYAEKEEGIKYDYVIYLDVSKEEVIRRLTARGRADDKPEIIMKRLEVYEEETAPLLDYYKDELIKIKAEGGTKEEIAQAIIDKTK